MIRIKSTKPNKYFAQKVKYNEITFDSKGEFKVYIYLKNLELNNKISNLELQPKYDLLVCEKKIGTYRADFRFIYNNNQIVVDFKGLDTPLSKRSRKHVFAQYNINVQVIKCISQLAKLFRS